MAKRFEEHQLEALMLAFEESNHLTKEKKIELVADTGLDVEQIASWFSRKRARKRTSESTTQLQLAHSSLQNALRLSRETEIELRKKLEESKNREAELLAENYSLKQKLTIFEGDKQFDSIMRLMNKW